jgi:hypothetical protein
MTLSRLTPQLDPQSAPALPRRTGAVSVALMPSSPAANDAVSPVLANDLRNPLWIIAIGMACFFGSAAAVMALS